MKTKRTTMSRLVVAAVLTLGFTACSGEDNSTLEPQTTPRKIHVTVGAGIGDDAGAQTRSHVTYEGGVRTLTFTEGDRLYVIGDIDDTHRMGGFLSLVSGAGTTSAMFSGDFTVWEKIDDPISYNSVEGYVLTNPDNPMLEYGDHTISGTLFHKDVNGNCIIEPTKYSSDPTSCRVDYTYSLVTGQTDNVNRLMETALHVRGTYDQTAGSFSLASGDPIFNCNFTVSGLSPNTQYFVRILKDDESIIYGPSVTTDENCHVHFACSIPFSGEGNWEIQFSTVKVFPLYGAAIYSRELGNRVIGAKVYNVGKSSSSGTGPNPATDVVSLSDVTSAFIGNVIGSDGQVYPPDASMPDGVGKAAMICYVPNDGHGLAIELNSNPTHSSSGGTLYTISGGSWRTPSVEDWQNMILGCAGTTSGNNAGPFFTKYNATGVQFYQADEYWTSDSQFDPVQDKTNYNFLAFNYWAERFEFVSEEAPPIMEYSHRHLSCFEF